MIVDETGVLWLSNPWLVVAVLVAVVSLVVWCHRWLEAGSAPLPGALAAQVRARGRPGRVRALPRRQAVRPALVTVARQSATGPAPLRVVASNGSPRSAA